MRKGSRKQEWEILFRFSVRNTKATAGMRMGSKKIKGEQERRKRTGMIKASRKDEGEDDETRGAPISDLLHVKQKLQQ
jgi:hypothetical protein